MEKHWSKLTLSEKHACYIKAIKSGNVEDSFTGFNKMMHNSIYNILTNSPIEI